MDSSLIFAPEEFATPQFTLRGYRPGDGALVNEAVNRSYDHLQRFMIWAQPYTTPDDSERLVRRWHAKYLLDEDYAIGIFAPDGARLLGSTGFHRRNQPPAPAIAEIGMWIRVDEAGKGLGTAALRAMLAWGFSAWPWQRLYWRCDVENTASARTAEKAGMTFEGIVRWNLLDRDNIYHDARFYGVFRADWKPGH
ncbi:MAG: GNAT family N-acetyltransferase [Anaerolineae bacterium]|nr:GNAT family N-acetyltransferase [Anaerolineae bacterium]